ncbi:MAG: adenosylmethionine--8-amino-7-oxononanoate transaminase [Phenylobacterium sp.]|uniref:adenosylmethionine--8-amino-7-oxononanoate transaminase n=1 Tax=Phenylobacterium sp. TaxID=1871053 RepID=UPI002718A568|nr:adenosylmethionine--8-amino-7-oxononanoate transaminase [Phenylobacterium sp.]MDO8913361.1 adenosylmethionine--8-amino-7-oxononanoate transaminase [Phenylobacterium sp.]MDP3101888.1 adenosylmethionine--8-amino-7-oxononanoate transaminase [Phenylobacterium sp.]
MPQWLTDGAPHVWRPYCQMKTAPAPLAVARTRGARIILEDGRELVDGIASWWTACHGYNHPHIAAAVMAQLDRAPHVMFGGLAHEPAYRLASRLAALLPGELDHVFFAESGSVAVEISMKMALQYWINRGVAGRTKFVSFLGGYHGDTLATMTICDPEEGMHGLFSGVMPAQHVVALPRDAESEAALDALLAEKGHEIAALIVEPRVQGAGGMLLHDDSVLATLRRLADRHGLLLIFDEIFTGFGRTGDLFACSGSGVIPDIVTLSKALTGGTLPLSAAIASRKVFEAFWSDDAGAALMHGPTYMANPLACAAANASLDLFESGSWKADVARISAALAEGLEPCRGAPGVVDVRTLGAIGVVEFAQAVDAGGLCARFAELGCWIRPMGKVVYLTPPFVTSDAEMARLTGAIRAVVGA